MSNFWEIVSALVAVITLMGTAYTIGVSKGYKKSREEINSSREAIRLSEIYAPLFGFFTTCHITTTSGRAAPYLRHRLRNACNLLADEGKPLQAFKALFNKQELGTSGEVEFGQDFPLSKITAHIRGREHLADRKLILLISHANRARYEESPADRELTDQDLRLFYHINSEHKRLVQKFGDPSN